MSLQVLLQTLKRFASNYLQLYREIVMEMHMDAYNKCCKKNQKLNLTVDPGTSPQTKVVYDLDPNKNRIKLTMLPLFIDENCRKNRNR